jgi:hypothetical protein
VVEAAALEASRFDEVVDGRGVVAAFSEDVGGCRENLVAALGITLA